MKLHFVEKNTCLKINNFRAHWNHNSDVNFYKQ